MPDSNPFLQAKWYTPANRQKGDVRVIVIHDMEAPEKGTTAESVAAYFAAGSGGRKASAHDCIDNNSIVQCVRYEDVAYQCPKLNHDGIGVEHAGYASQTSADWDDPFSHDMLEISAKHVAHLCHDWDIPPVFVDAAGLRAGNHGITTHAEGSKAYTPGGHTDPGPNFPMAHYIERVDFFYNGGAPAPAPEEPLMVTPDDEAKIALIVENALNHNQKIEDTRNGVSTLLKLVGGNAAKMGDTLLRSIDKIKAKLGA